MASEKEPDKQEFPIVPIGPQNQLPEFWSRQYGNKNFISSVPVGKSTKNISHLMRHLQAKGENGDAWLNREFGLVHRTFYPARRVNDDGEESVFVGICLETDKGDLIRLGSSGVLKSLSIIECLGRPAPWNPPLRVRLLSIPLSNGKRMFQLELIDDDDSSTKRK